jgi:hypothetical protein
MGVRGAAQEQTPLRSATSLAVVLFTFTLTYISPGTEEACW